MTRTPSTDPAESTTHNMWMDFAIWPAVAPTAENAWFSHSFLYPETAGRNGEDCYTFEGFASSPVEIRSAYYYHYKRNTFGLKEEMKWS
jgi:hypothetical protein